ncbi:hypothetical protein HMSSN139_60540 [Paenibacillus sp. HMSSN-139]|nr:hypothetical protein HMSSN139_60540 [Paenibacillus sp. HMSSN-139]
MARRLEGKRVALTGPRRAEELGKLVENMGGTPLYRPAQGTVLLDDQALRSGIVDWVEHPPDWSIFTTGMGLDALFDMAGEMGVAEQLREHLRVGKIAARGYKTVNALKKRELTPIVRDDDGSTEGLIRGLAEHELRGATVLLQLHGDPAPRLVAWLEEQGAECRQLLPYRHIAPPAEALEQLLNDILAGEVGCRDVYKRPASAVPDGARGAPGTSRGFDGRPEGPGFGGGRRQSNGSRAV